MNIANAAAEHIKSGYLRLGRFFRKTFPYVLQEITVEDPKFMILYVPFTYSEHECRTFSLDQPKLKKSTNKYNPPKNT